MINLILSLDYEVFGNGAGDVKKLIIEPTNRLLNICDTHNAKLTIMFEVAEYWAFKEAEEKGLLNLGYSPASLMKNQVIDAIKKGHDVQLHLHPQWIGAKYKNSYWHLNMNQYRVADLPNGIGDINDKLSIKGAIFQGKRTLEEMLKPYKNGYECIAFRAGGYYLQPEKDIIRAMKEIGIKLDSSVVKWYKTEAPLKLDYRDAYKNYGYWWTTSKSITQKGSEKENIIELPVFSELKPYIYNFAIPKLKATLKRRKIEKNDKHRLINKKESTPNSSTILKKLFEKHPHNLDYCKLSASSMYNTVNKYSKMERDKLIPIVMIGHNKDFWNDKNLDKFLKRVTKNKNIIFSTFSETVENLK